MTLRVNALFCRRTPQLYFLKKCFRFLEALFNRLSWYPLSPVAALCFVASVFSSYLVRVVACLTDECLAPSFRRHLATQAAADTRAYNFQHRQAPCANDQSRAGGTRASSSRYLGPYFLTLDTGVVGRTEPSQRAGLRVPRRR